MPKCPVCDTQYDEARAEDCLKCGWILKLYSPNDPLLAFQGVAEKKSELLQHIEAWARKSWEKEQLQVLNENHDELRSKLQKVIEENDELKKKLAQLQGKSQQDTSLALTQENEQLRRIIERVHKLEQETKELKLQRSSDAQNLIAAKAELKDIHQEAEIDINKLQTELEEFRNIYVHVEYFTKLKTKVEEIEVFLNSVTANSQHETYTQSIHQNQQIAEHLSSKNDIDKPPTLTSEEYKLVNDYQKNKDQLSKVAIEVNLTQETMDANRLGSPEIIFKKVPGGSYWIINREGCKYLVPKKGFRINQYNLRTTEDLFECWGYPSGNSKDFQLLKPATVSESPESETWKLLDRGTLQFYS